MTKLLTIIFAAILLAGCRQLPQVSTPSVPDLNYSNSSTNINNSPTPTMPSTPSATPTVLATSSSQPAFATIKTSMGSIKIKLFSDQAPQTVANFIALANGTRDWINPKTGQVETKTPLYSGTIFHRVIDGFMIQGGDPLGTGTGGPGYQFPDEFNPDLSFDKPYLLAMANSGPNTNGSQFFITVAKTPWLNQHHTIFGEVVDGKEVVDTIATTKVDAQNKPVKPVKILQVVISSK